MGKVGFVIMFAVTGVCAVPGQKPAANPRSHAVAEAVTKSEDAGSVSDEDRLSLIAAALDAKVRGTEPDCSHLVHAIYQQAGLSYAYAPSSELYAGIDGFQRVKKPEPGDLVVWRGHAGIVIKPSQHIFFSVLSTGPGIDDYTTSYWKRRGKPRFYRYVKSMYGPKAPSPRLLRANRGAATSSDSDAEGDDER